MRTFKYLFLIIFSITIFISINNFLSPLFFVYWLAFYYKEDISLLHLFFHLFIYTRWTHGFLLYSVYYDPFYHYFDSQVVPYLASRISFKMATVPFWNILIMPWALSCFLMYQYIPIHLVFPCPCQGVSLYAKICVIF